jgi:hypothetical protein
MMEAQTTIHRDIDQVAAFGAERYGAPMGGPGCLDVVRAQAAKRVALQFVPQRTATWDHRKLSGEH